MPGILTLLIGRELCERYRVDSVIGTGGMGAVCRAYDAKLHRHVAVKVMTAVVNDPAEQERLRLRFDREARAAARLRHPNVVTVHDFGTDPELGIDFLVMELLAGEDLAGRMRRAGGPLAVDESLEIFREAAMGLAAGHRVGLVHRDVKPGNIYLVAEPGGWEVKLLDFGIAFFAAESDTPERLTLAGAPHTPRYASPEQLRGDTPLTPASDVYALALTALEMLDGAYPEGLNASGDDRAAARAIKRILADNPVPLGLAAVIRRALRLDPAARIPDADALLRALAEAETAAAHPGRPVPGAASIIPTPPPRASAAAEDEGTLYAPPPPGTFRVADVPAGARAVDRAAPPPGAAPPAEVVEAPHPRFDFRMIAIILVSLLAIGAVIGLGVALQPGAPPESASRPPQQQAGTVPEVTAPGGDEVALEEVRRVTIGHGAAVGDTLWMVVLASFDGAGQLDRAMLVRDRLRQTGHEVGLANDMVYPELRAGYLALLAGPYDSHAEAEEAKARFREGLSTDCFVKRVTLREP